MSSSTTIVKILWRYQQREELSEEELSELRLWLMESPRNEELFADLSDGAKWEKETAEWKNKDPTATWNKISKRIKAISPEAFRRKRDQRRFLTAALLLLVLSSVVVYIMLTKERLVSDPKLSQKIQEIQPATGTAFLTLSNGTSVAIDSLRAGVQTKQGGTVVVKTDSGALAYKTTAGTGGDLQYNTLSTAKGNQYQVLLSDGTTVWLNAASSLRFPVAFNGSERRVHLTGEGYFEVAKDRAKPFVVETGRSIFVRVLGTHFNIKAYREDSTAHVALLEGSIFAGNRKDSAVIKPGEEARINEGTLGIHPANLEQAMAWRNKLFWFKNDSFEEVMQELSRWYDMDVVYKGEVRETYTGILPGNLPLSNILKILEKGGNVHFTIEGRNKVVVRP